MMARSQSMTVYHEYVFTSFNHCRKLGDVNQTIYFCPRQPFSMSMSFDAIISSGSTTTRYGMMLQITRQQTYSIESTRYMAMSRRVTSRSAGLKVQFRRL